MPEYFITGTDTGVGKTVVTTAMLTAAQRRGLLTAAYKPAETGCPRDPSGRYLARDAAMLAGAADLPGDESTICRFRYETPAAPAVAARIEGHAVEIDAIQAAVDGLRAKRPDLLMVEGAGGLLVPFTDDHTAADLARILSLDLLVVARPGLGTINHTALSVECARARGLRVRGVILSHASPEGDPTVSTNASEIERLTGVRVLGALGHTPSLAPDSLAAAAERDIDLDDLLT